MTKINKFYNKLISELVLPVNLQVARCQIYDAIMTRILRIFCTRYLKVKSINNTLLSCNHLVIIDNHISTRKLTINKMNGNMNACHIQEVEIVSSTSKLIDASKYNLRCNRNISEKMTKKDFIYDIPTAAQTMRNKLEIQKRPFIPFILQLRRKVYADSKMPLRYIISKKIDHDGSGDATVITNRRTLKYECNFCHEPIATLFSLSTHVKFHRQIYCKICYWILDQNETMEQHISSCHQNSSGIIAD